MNREFLKSLGLEEAEIDKIMAEHGKSVNAIKAESDSVTTERDDLKEQLADRDSQLDELSGKVKDSEELTTTINELKESNATATQELQDKLDAQAFDFMLDKSLAGAKVKNTKAVKALLDTETIKLDGDKLLNLDDQLSAIKESDSYLFESDSENPPPSFSTGQHGSAGNANEPINLSQALTEHFNK